MTNVEAIFYAEQSMAMVKTMKAATTTMKLS
jgi:hypothetical protein